MGQGEIGNGMDLDEVGVREKIENEDVYEYEDG